MQYQYLFEGSVNSKALVTGSEDSRMALTANVVITANTRCDLKMQITNLAVEDVTDEDTQWFREAVEQYDLHFSYQDGRVAHLCPHQDEDVIALNFKRGILSALQVTITNVADKEEVVVDEGDVSGTCKTLYSVSNQNDLIVTKIKENCRSNGFLPYVPHSHYTTGDSSIQLPFFRRNQTCQMHQRAGVWEQVTCLEEIRVDGATTAAHRSHLALANVYVKSSLSLQAGPVPSQGNFSQYGYLQTREPLLMDLKGAFHSDRSRKFPEADLREQIDSALESLSESMTENLELELQRPHAFSHLVNLLGHIQLEEDLESVWDTYSAKEGYREFLLDAVMLCESSQCVQLVVHLATHDDSGVLLPRVINWLTGLHFHANPHPQAITYIMELAQSKKGVVNQAVMAASTMVYKVCQQEPQNCQDYAQPLVEYVEEQVGDTCGLGASQRQGEHIKLLLRALGNAGVLPHGHFPETCYKNRLLAPEVRVAALQSYRRIGCPPRSAAPWKILEDGSEKVDVRIAAYLSLVPCALNTPGFFTRINYLLEREDINQVGSYIWTHVHNLVENPGPSDYDQRLAKLAAQHTLPDKFSINTFRSSQNYRYAQFSETLNLGGSVASDVIFTPDSYIPRKVSVNLTLDVLDKSLNVLEFGGDFSRMEDIIERFFSNDGYFENEEILNVLQTFRPKRNIIRNDKIQEFQKLYDEEQTAAEVPELSEEEPKASVYLRVFGNEIIYSENLLKTNPMRFLHQLVQQFSTPRSFQVMDQEYMSTTLLGFPLKLRLNATGSVTFNRKETFQRRGTQGVLLEGRVAPSAVVAVDETLIVDGYGSSSGIRRTTTQIARTNFGGKIAIENGQIAEAQIDIPKSELTRLRSSVEVALFRTKINGWETQRARVSASNTRCWSESLTNALGVRACGTLAHSVHSPNGESYTGEPYVNDFVVAKTDTFNYYKLYIKKQENVLEAIFDTPGSSIDRKVNFLFNVRPNNAGGYIAIRGMGFGIEGQYENTEISKKIALQYLEKSKVAGELEVSLQKQEEGASRTFIPEILLTLGSDVFTLGGRLTCNHQQGQEEGVKVNWELSGNWQRKKEVEVFSSTSGNLIANPDKTQLQVGCTYGSDYAHPHMLVLAFDSSKMMEQGQEKYKGYILLESTQAETDIKLDFEHQPGRVEVNANITVQRVQVASEVILKNIVKGDDRDLQLKVNFVNQHLNTSYFGNAVYKVSENAFHGEAELMLDSLIQSKLAATYLLEREPLHLLAGLRFQYSDYILEVQHNIDFSEPDYAVITMSGAVGAAVGALRLEADYREDQPITATLEAYGGLEGRQAGASLSLTADHAWQTFTVRSNLRWFEQSYTTEHKAVFDAGKTLLYINFDNSTTLEAIVETSPNFLVLLSVWDHGGEDPAYQFKVGKHVFSERTKFEATIRTGEDHLFQTVLLTDRGNTFIWSLRLLESEASINGEFRRPSTSVFEGSAQARVMLPSGQTFSSNLSLTHINDGSLHSVAVLLEKDQDIIEGHLTLVNRGGWFQEDVTSFNLTLTTPFSQLQNFSLLLQKHSDTTMANFAEIKLDDFKIRGEARLGGPADFEIKVLYEDGDTCDSYIHIYHIHDNQHSVSGASLALTELHRPWEVTANTTMDFSGWEQLFNIELSFESPMLAAPLQLHGTYNMSEDHLGFEIQGGMEEKVLVLFLGKREESPHLQKLYGLASFDTPWTAPTIMNVTLDQATDSFGILIDFQSTWEWLAEFSTNFSSAEDTQAHLYLTHSALQITLDLAQNFSLSGFRQQVEGSVNTLTITSVIDADLDENLVPLDINGRLSLLNLMDHNLDLTFSHTREPKPQITQISLAWDDQIFSVDHTLDMEHYLQWSSLLQIIQPGNGDIIESKISLHTESDMAFVNSSFQLRSPWSEDFKAQFVVQGNSTVMDYTFDVSYGNASVLTLMVVSTEDVNWYQSDLVLGVTSSYFNDAEIKWKHNLDTGHLVSVEVSYGSDFNVQGTSHLIFSQQWLEQEFISYDFLSSLNITDLDVNFKVLFKIDSQYNGKFEGMWSDYCVSVASAVNDGIIFSAKINDSEAVFQSEIQYEKGNGDLPNLQINFAKNGHDIYLFKIVSDAVYPKVDNIFSLEIFSGHNDTSQTAQLRVTADMTDIARYALKGKVEVKSDIDIFEGFGGSVEVNARFNSMLSWNGHVSGLLDSSYWHYRGDMNGSLELSQEFSMEYGILYEATHENKTFDRKEMSLAMNVTDEILQMKFTVSPDHVTPHWSFHVYYNKSLGDLRVLVWPGDPQKYEISCRLSSKTFTISAHSTHEDGSKVQYLKGNINWIIRQVKHLISINMDSDINYISKITGQLIIQHKRDLAVTAKLTVNQQNFAGTMRYTSHALNSPNRLNIKIENDIIMNFKTDIDFDFSVKPEGFTIDLSVDMNEDEGWLEGNLKLGVPESHLHLKMPITDWETFNLTVNVQTDDVYGFTILLQVPQMCFNVTSAVDKSYLSAVLRINMQLNYIEEAIFDFCCKFSVDKNKYHAYCNLTVQDLGVIFKFNCTGHLKWDELEVKLESELYPQVLVDVGLLAEKKDHINVRLHVYEPSSNTTYLLYRNFFSPNKTELFFGLEKDNFVSLVADYNIQRENTTIDVTFSFSYYGFVLNLGLGINARIMPDSGNVEVHFTSDSEIVRSTFSVAYINKDEMKEGTFNLTTTYGDVRGELKLIMNEKLFSFVSNITSDLHSFQKYHFEFIHKTEGPIQNIKILSAQDDIEFQINGLVNMTNDEIEVKLTLSTSFEKYEIFDLEFSQPVHESSYKAKFTIKSFGKEYAIDTRHSHHESWESQMTEITLTFPLLEHDKLSLVVMYDALAGEGSAVLSTPQGQLGLEGTWQYLESNVALSLTSHLTYFDLGKYTLTLDIPPEVSQGGELCLSHRHAALDFDTKIKFSEYFRNGNISFNFNSEPKFRNITYGIGYEFQNSLKIDGQFDDRKVTAKLSLDEHHNPALLGSFEIETNFKGYESIDGSWNIELRDEVYSAQVNIDIAQQGSVAVNGAIDTQPEGASVPWDSVKLTIHFESPFTLTHHLQAEYDLRTLSVATYYQYGLDTFQIQWSSDFRSKMATVLFSGNIPVQGISSFSVNFKYDFTKSYTSSFTIKIEETTLQSSFEFSPNWKVGSIMASLTSPFVKPVMMLVKWSCVGSPISLRATYDVGKHSGELKTTLEYGRNSAHGVFQVTTSFEEASKFNIEFLYDISDNGKWEAAIVANINRHTLNLKTSLIINEPKFLVKFSGFMELFGINASVEIDVGIYEGIYKGSVSGKILGYEKFSISFLLDLYQFYCNIKYKMKEVFTVNANYYQTNIQLDVDDYWHFNLSTHHKTIKNGHHFDVSFNGFDLESVMLQANYTRKRNHQLFLSLSSPALPPISIHVTYSSFKDNQVDAKVTVGKEMYHLVGRAEVERKQSSFEIKFDSPEDPNNPFIFKAMYDFKKFLRGKMNSAMDLASVTLEWGKQLHLNVSGMRNDSQVKMNLTVMTPFTLLPKLLLGFDSEFSFKKAYVELKCSGFIELSQRITASGFFKLEEEEVDLTWALTMPYIEVENLTLSLQLKPGRMEANLLLNNDAWKAIIDYELFKTYSIVISVETPVTNFEKLSLTTRAETENDQFMVQIELKWPKAQTLLIRAEVETLNIRITFLTPWEQLRSGFFSASLETDDENQNYSSVLKWDKRNIKMLLTVSPGELQFVSQYYVDNTVIGLVRFESALESREFKSSLQIQTPYAFIRSLETTLHLQNQGFLAKMVINDVTSHVEGLYSRKECKFTAILPILGNFKWTLDAKNYWTKIDTRVRLSVGERSEPLSAAFSYEVTGPALHGVLEVGSGRQWLSVDVKYDDDTWSLILTVMDTLLEISVTNPSDGASNLNLTLESPNLNLKLLKLNVTAKYEGHLEFIDGSLSISVKTANKKLFKYNINFGVSIIDDQLLVNFEFQGDRITEPYKITGVLPIANIFFEEVNIEFNINQGEEELYKLRYETVFPDSVSSRRLLEVESSGRVSRLQVDLSDSSLGVSLSYPDSSTQHTLLLNVNDDVSFENFMLHGELHSPYLIDGPLKMHLHFVVQDQFHGILNCILSHGTANITVSGEFRYNRKQHEITTKFLVTSGVTFIYSIEAKLQWNRDITAFVILNILGNEHSFKLHLDMNDFSLEMISKSTWLPVEEIIFSGKLNHDIELSNINYEGKLITENMEIIIDAAFKKENFNHINSYIIVKINKEEVFTLSGVFYADKNRFDFDFDMYSIIPDLNYNVEIRYKNTEEKMTIDAKLNGALLQDKEFVLKIMSNKWYNVQSLDMSWSSYWLQVVVDINRLTFRSTIQLDHEIYKLSLEYNTDLKSIYLQAPFTYCENFYFQVRLRNDVTFIYLENAWRDLAITFTFELGEDEYFGKGVQLSLRTPFKGYEKFSFITPHYTRDVNHRFSVMLEYPGCKVGLEVFMDYKNLFDSDLEFSLYLPYEKYEIISLRYRFLRISRINIGARVGKVGFMFSVRDNYLLYRAGLEVRLELNEYSIQLLLRDFSVSHKLRSYINIDFDVKELIKCRSFRIEWQVKSNEMVYLIVQSDQEEHLKVHAAWGSDKVFAITTPKVYPGFLTINLQSTEMLDDFHFMFSFPTVNNTWETYRIHLHEEALEAGHHAFISVEGFEKQFQAEGTLSLNSFHFNESLMLEINKKKIGTKILLQREPGLFTSIYTGDVFLVLPSQSVHYSTNASAGLRDLYIISSFTWNEYDHDMPPLTLKMNYNDKSIFRNMEYCLKAVFSHPDIKDVIFQGNITQSPNSPLRGLAELVDINDHEKNIVMMLDVQPPTHHTQYNILVNISQPSSKLALIINSQITESVLTKANYTFKYWSPIRETWEDLNIITDVSATETGYEFAANILASQGKWGYRYNGNINSTYNSATFNIQGSQVEFGEFWKLGTTVNKNVPELVIYLDIGQQNQEPYEERRVRIGFQNPLEFGAILDHQRFNERTRDCAVGLKLVAPNILQFFLDFDPSLDYNADNFWARLTSPAYKIVDAWEREVAILTSASHERLLLEVPKVIDMLVNKEAILSIWARETSNFEYFTNELNSAVRDINEDIERFWTESLEPLLQASHRITTALYSQYYRTLVSWGFHLSVEMTRAATILHKIWEDVHGQISPMFTDAASWVMDEMHELWEKVKSHFINVISEYLKIMIEPVLNTLMSALDGVTVTLQGWLHNTESIVTPHLHSLVQEFNRYRQEIGTVLLDQCWRRISAKFEKMSTMKEDISSVLSVLSQLLQTDQYYHRFVNARDEFGERLQNTWSILKDGMSQLQQAVRHGLEPWTWPLINFSNQMKGAITTSATQMTTEEVVQFIKDKMEELQLKVSSTAEETRNTLKENLESFQKWLSSHSAFKDVIGGSVYEKIMTALEKWNTSQRNSLDTLDKFIFLLADFVHQLLKNNNYFLDELYVYKPEKYGKIRYNQYLPVPWTSFLEAPHWHYLTKGSQNSTVVEAQHLLTPGVSEVSRGWQTLAAYEVLTRPVTATATIAGQHVTTFDLRHYEFLGSCSYLLTKDFVTDDFEVVGIYKAKDGAASLDAIVVHGQRIDVTLHVDGTVETSQAGAQVHSENGYSALKMPDLLVTCSRHSQGCSITVGGKYFNRLSGLLGNYNYEPSDDSLGPSGERALDVADLARMWAVSPNPCYQANQARQLDDISEAEDLTECAQLFLHSSSPLSDCFHAVDPRPYFTHCINGQSHPAFSDNDLNSPCSVLSSYRTQCWTQGVQLPEPEVCLPEVTGMCNVSGEARPSGWLHTYQKETEGSADIAIIVELSGCPEEINITKLFKALTDQLKKRGIRDVRYVVVAITGETVSWPRFMTEREAVLSVSAATPHAPTNASLNTQAIVSTAENVEWRPGVSRTIVHITCQECREGETIEKALKARDVTYHLITKLNIIMAAPSEKESLDMAHKVYGFDERLVFLTGDFKKFKGNEKMRLVLQEPTDVCVKAAQASGGAVFNLHRWNVKKAVQEKKFLSVVGQRIALSSSAPECQECHCISEDIRTVLMCRACSTTPVFSLPVEKGKKTVMQNNTAIIDDIKRNFKEDFIKRNIAFTHLGIK
ncbi:uncharacterized protein [Procambarus clarkii]